jgi:acetylornithine deacetylase/succinyl-diaminopimelate desuccinylase-like protein
LERQIEITSIPAPSFKEEARGKRMAELFREVGLQDVVIDEVGNVLGWYPGRWCSNRQKRAGAAPAEHPPLIISAHLDTVFPEGTDVTPKREEGRIRAPGISDDGRGLAALLALARVMVDVTLTLPQPLLFVATVGEEGPGNLRGVRHLLAHRSGKIQGCGFVSLDGVGMDRIIHRGVGSTRLRLSLRGPGGHSWTDFGRPNPIHHLGRMVSRAGSLPLPPKPRSSLTVARWGGGTSINSIPQEAWVEVDLRSEGAAELKSLEEDLHRVCAEELENASEAPEGSGRLQLEVQEIGRRPAGYTDLSEPIVRAAVEATRLLGEKPRLVASSTDANLPMSLGIPAITMGAGGSGGGIHTLEEWYDNQKGPEGILRALLTVLLLD